MVKQCVSTQRMKGREKMLENFERGKPELVPSNEEIISMFSNTRCLPMDIETTDCRGNLHIIELGIAEFVDGVLANQGSRIFGGGKSHPKALEVHGITDEERAGKPTFYEKAPFFKRLVERRTFASNGVERRNILIGHNIEKFDIRHLLAACRKAGCPVRTSDGYVWVVDTLLLSRRHLGSPIGNKLEDLCPAYGITHGAHRALGDSLSAWFLLHIIMKKANISHVNNICKQVKL